MAKDKGNGRLYRIGEAAAALKLKTCVLRFWEGEFPQLAPLRTPKGQRLYREDDLRVLRRIRSLLHEKGMTIDGARRILSGEMPMPAPRSNQAFSALSVPSESKPAVPSAPVPFSVPAAPSALAAPSPLLASRLSVPRAGKLALQAAENLRTLENAARELRELYAVLSRFSLPSSPEHVS